MSSLIPVGIVLDTTALVSLGAGSADARHLVATSRDYHRALYASATCLYQANRQRPGVARYLYDRIDEINPVGLDTASVVEMTDTLPKLDIDIAHTIHLALPGRTWPAGRAVATTQPELYEPYRIPVYQID